jgi:hypothetical protein
MPNLGCTQDLMELSLTLAFALLSLLEPIAIYLMTTELYGQQGNVWFG